MNSLTGTGTLLRFIFRRDRVRVPAWIVSLVALVWLTAIALPETFPTPEERQARGELVNNPAIRFLVGPGFEMEEYTYGAMMANEMLGISMVLVALMSMFMISRHTRVEEESGRLELISALPVGRHAALTAALVATLLVNLAIGLGVGFGLPLLQADLDLNGSLLFGAAMIASGMFFAIVAAIASQIHEFARSANGLAGALLGMTYAVRGFGDSLEAWPSWTPPFGLALQSAPWVYDRWWAVLLLFGLSLILLPVSVVLNSRRDAGAGLVRPTPGPPNAAPGLASPFGMALRLQRGSFLGWAVGVGLLAGGIGSIIDDAAELFTDNTLVMDMLETLDCPRRI